MNTTIPFKKQRPSELVKAITEIATAMPPASIVRLYEFAVFLNTHPYELTDAKTEEASIEADEAIWTRQFEAITDEQFATMIASVEAEIDDEMEDTPSTEEALAAVERLTSLFADVNVDGLEEALNDPMLELINVDLELTIT